MGNTISFIERQFPVSKMSKESYKERKSSQGQTITGLGKWWGRKPLILVRAAILGCLLPATDNPSKDMEMFLRLLSMDENGLELRREKKFSTAELYKKVMCNHKLKNKYAIYFSEKDEKVTIDKDAPKDEIDNAVFRQLSYDDKITLCVRPEQLENISSGSWAEINNYYGTSAYTLQEFVEQISTKRYGHNISVGDCFCGGGSIPFEAARIGCNTYASDLNPIAGLLTWADLHICGASESDTLDIISFLQTTYDEIDAEICKLGVEHNENGDRALSYLYCVETICPECGWRVPLLPNLVVGIRAGKVIAELKENNGSFDILVHNNVSASELSAAQKAGTCKNNSLVCPHCGKTTPISALRHDTTDANGDTVYGLRKWDKTEFEFRDDDVYHERLYAIRYEHQEICGEKIKKTRYYTSPSFRDLENEKKIHDIVAKNFDEWQKKGLIPSMAIENGDKTCELIRNRGWGYWHQLFNVRQLFVLSCFSAKIAQAKDQIHKATALISLNRCVDFCSKLCRFDPSTDKVAQTFYNQAFNSLMTYGTRSLTMLKTQWNYLPKQFKLNSDATVLLKDARDVSGFCDIWITDPPYADAVNYHELSEFFLAWDKNLIQKAFPEWYTDSRRVLAVRGDEHFSDTMIEIYSNLAKHMPDDGMQVVMFTHSDPAVWAQLAIIMWKAGLKVTAAWNIATETEASGLKSGNYVKGTVLLVLRKQTGDEEAFLDEIEADIRSEVKKQIESMQSLDDKEEPNFSDPDYVLAAYAASLKVLTSYAEIEDLNLDYELSQAISNPSKSEVVKIIENAKRIAYDCVIPSEFEGYLWKDLSNSERFYIKGLESEKHGDYQIGTYQEYARGFSIGGYSQLMANEKANTARLKTPFEMGTRTLNDVPDFESSLMRTLFTGIYVGIKEEMNPQKALGYIKGELSNYWDRREMIKQILSFLVDCQDISNMQPHWTDSSKMAEMLLASVTHDSI